MQGTGTGSLERFVKTKGWLFSSVNCSRRAFKIQGMIGGSLLAVGLAIMAMPLFGAEKQLFFASLGPVIAGGTNLIVAAAMKKRFNSAAKEPMTLSSEARSVMRALNRKYNPRKAWEWDDSMWQEQMGWTPGTQGSAAASADLSEAVLEELEKAAYQYNRIAAVLVAAGSAQSSVVRMATKVETAANESMGDVLHQAGLLAAFPEGSEAVSMRLHGTIKDLTELADRTQALLLAEPTFTERLVQRTGIQDVLDELRLEQAARSELGSKAASDQEARLDR